MRDFFFSTYLMNNAVLTVLVVGYALSGLVFGFIWGDTRARRDEARSRWSSN